MSLIRGVAVRSNDSQGPIWTVKTDQTGRMPRLIWVFAVRSYHFVDLVVRRLKYNKMNVISMLNIVFFPYRWGRLNFRVSLSTYSVSSKHSWLTRLFEYTVWSESSLGVHIIFLNLKLHKSVPSGRRVMARQRKNGQMDKHDVYRRSLLKGRAMCWR